MMTDQDWADQDREYARDCEREAMDRLIEAGAIEIVEVTVTRCEASPESPALELPAPDAEEETAWDREETDSCERGTPGCSVRHTRDSECATW